MVSAKRLSWLALLLVLMLVVGFAPGAAGAEVGTLPGAPTGVVATPGVAEAVVAWSAPAAVGSPALASFVVVASPGGASVTVGGAVRSVVVPCPMVWFPGTELIWD